MFDVLIIGGGVSGVSAALIFGSAKEKSFMVDKKIGVIAHQKSSSLQKALFNKIFAEAKSLIGSPIIVRKDLILTDNPISIVDSSIEVYGDIHIDDTNFDDKIKSLSQDKLRILFEHGVDYNIFDKEGNINDSRLERMFKDFNI